jgi:hypothetical protein
MKNQLTSVLCAAIVLLSSCDIGSMPDQPHVGYLVIDEGSRDISAIPASAVETAKADLVIAYNHTSHGSQLITGMNAIEAFPDFAGRYAWSQTGDAGSLELRDGGIGGSVPDLSQGDYVDGNGDTPWVVSTRSYLDAHPEVNVIMWSWCSINGHDARRYVDNMEKLIAEYPGVSFVFMTGHAEGQGEDLTPGSVHYNNELIRRHCEANGRILYDFAAIESYNPDGAYFWDLEMYDNLNYDGGNWAVQWIAAHPGHMLTRLTTGIGVDGYGGCQGTAHSDSPQEANLNGVLKGIAAWHLFARLAGWEG